MPLRYRNKSRIPLKRKTWIPPAYARVPSGVPSFAAQPFKTYKLRNKILAGGKTIHFGNNVSEFFNRTRRVWRPNIKVKSLWSEALGRTVRLRMVTSVLRTIDKVGGLDAYLTCTKRGRMKELGPRGWEIRAAVIKALRQSDRPKYVRMLQRSILLCPKLTLDSEWKEIRPLIKHTEGYAVLPEQFCKKAFDTLMRRLREGRPIVRKQKFTPQTIVLSRGLDSKFVRQVRLMNMPKHIKKRWRPRRTSASTMRSKTMPMTPKSDDHSDQNSTTNGRAENSGTEEKIGGAESDPKLKAKQKEERNARAKRAWIDGKKKRKAQLA